MADHGNVIISFDKVKFAYNPNKPILEEASFSIRQNSKITIMGQNGAGKSTIFKLITKEIKPESGQANVSLGATIAIATQVMKPENLEKTIEEFFGQVFDQDKKIYDLPKRIAEVLEIVHLTAPLDKKVKQFSGGQQARLLLAYALIQ